MGADTQTIPARHATATFVPAGSTIKIINTSGTQVIDTWAFALPTPPSKDDESKQHDNAQPNGKLHESETKPDDSKQKADEEPKQKTDEPKQAAAKSTPKRTKSRKGDMDLPSQEDAELATSQGIQSTDNKQNGTPSKKGWSAYIPSVSLRGNKSEADKKQIKENSRNWGKYLSVGQNYIPSKQTISAFASSHYRDTNKPYIQQLSDFARTPVGAAGISALSGQGYTSSLYAGYSAWTGSNSDLPAPMEYLSMPHTRASTCHLSPRQGDVMVSNLREPMLTVLEDTAGVHDTLISACDPSRYRQLGVDKWSEHGSCAENLVLALKELNERAGLKGAKGIGADVTVNSVPPPLNLFMNIPCTNQGDLSFESPRGNKGDYVRFRAERDVVIVMSACPNDVQNINAKQIEDAHFVVEEELDPTSEDVRKRLRSASLSEKQKKPAPARRPARKLNTGGKKPAASAAKAKASSSRTPAEAKKDSNEDTKKDTKPISSPEKASASSRPAPQTNPSEAGPSTPARNQQQQQSPTPVRRQSTSAGTPARNQEQQQRPPPTPVRQESASTITRRDSASTVPSNTKHPGAPSTIGGSRRTSQITTTTLGNGAGPNEDAAASATGSASAQRTEKKKPRKLERRTAAA